VGVFADSEEMVARSDYILSSAVGLFNYLRSRFCPGAVHLHTLLISDFGLRIDQIRNLECGMKMDFCEISDYVIRNRQYEIRVDLTFTPQIVTICRHYERVFMVRTYIRWIVPLLYPIVAATIAFSQVTPPSQTGGATATEGTQAGLSAQALERALSDSTYIVGPGDGFIIGILGERYISYSVEVTPEGKIVLPTVGEIYINDMTLAVVREQVTSRLSRAFRNVVISTSLFRLRTFKVSIVGEVRTAGVVYATPVDYVSEAIARVGGLLPSASMRTITIQRGDSVIKKVDLFRYFKLGDVRGNPYLKGGDIIIVPKLTQRVSLFGEVASPGQFEFVPGDRLFDLIQMGQGLLTSSFLDSVELTRFLPDHVTTKREYLDIHSYPSQSDANIVLQQDDHVFIRQIPKWHFSRLVNVQGEVKYPGFYSIERTTTLSQLIERVGGFTDEASLEEAAVVRAVGADTLDREFERLRGIPPADMKEDEYQYFLAKSREKPGAVVVDFKKLFLQGDKREDVLLREGDQVTVPRFKNYVRVIGRVNSPGNVTYISGWRYEQYITRAGGYGWRADDGDVRIIKARTGQWFDADNDKEYVLEPGDVIWVPERERIDWWKVAQTVFLVASQIATVIVVIQFIIQQNK
jgi:protein involved in polysaccharide export with SLBB domain